MTDLPAGDFASRLVEIRKAIDGECSADVPCGARVTGVSVRLTRREASP